jgi:hypothetical protein
MQDNNGVGPMFFNGLRRFSSLPRYEFSGNPGYLATKNIMTKWTQRYRNWDMVLNQLLIMFPWPVGAVHLSPVWWSDLKLIFTFNQKGKKLCPHCRAG